MSRRPECQGRSGSRNRKVAGSLVVICLLAFVGPPAVGQSDERPWELPGDERELARQYRAPDYWFERYLRADAIMAKQINKGGQGDPAELDKAIALLRLSIAKKTSASAVERHPTERTEFPYVPYFLLAMAFYDKNDFESATLCLREAELQAAVQRTQHAAKFATLQGDLSRRVELARLGGAARLLGQWQDGGLGACMSDQGRQQAGQIQESFGAMTRQNTPADEVRSRMATEIGDLVKSEAVRMAGYIDKVRSAEWTQAFVGQPLRIAGACDLASMRVDPAEMAPVEQRLRDCCNEASQVLRFAGQQACATLSAKNREVQDRIEIERRFGGDPGAAAQTPSVPAVCSSTSWDALEVDALSTTVDRIAFADTYRQLEASLSDVTARLARKQDELQRQLTTSRQKIVTADRTCARDLGLGEANNRLAALRDRIDQAMAGQDPTAAAALSNVDAEIETARSALVSRAVEGADRLIGFRDQLEGIDTGSFSALPGASDAFRQNPSQSALDALCRSVSGVQVAINQWGQDNIPAFERGLARRRWHLEVAGQWQPAEESRRLACIDDSLAAYPGAYSRANSSAWVNQAQAAMAQSTECLIDYREEHEGWTAALRLELDGLVEAAGRLAQGGSLQKIEEMSQNLGATKASLDAIESLLALPEGASEQSLRKALQESGLAVPDERWGQLGRLAGDDSREELLIIRDEAIGPRLAAAEAELMLWRPLVGKVRSYLALDRAMQSYNRGDLDRAILALRRDESSEPAEGKAGAMMHAALSYFLHTKWQLIETRASDGRVSTLLLDDARLEAHAALEAQPEFQLPAFLVQSTNFRDFFDSCRSM